MAPKLKLITEPLPLTDECLHYKNRQEVPQEIQKYWSQRYSIFSLYDSGIRFTNDAWFGVTPEPVATQIASEIFDYYPATKTTLIDCFGGIGGNTIAFALSARWFRVICVERDPSTLACAMHNAAICQVPPEAILFVLGDSFELLHWAATVPKKLPKELRVTPEKTVVFASPPWGGPGYVTDEVFDLSRMEPYNLNDLHSAYKRFEHALFLPRTSDLRQIAEIVPEGTKVDVVHYCMTGASKALVVYLAGDPDVEPAVYSAK